MQIHRGNNFLTRNVVTARVILLMKTLVRLIGLEINRAGTVDRLATNLKNKGSFNFGFYSHLPSMDSKILLKCLELSQSQYGQEIFALAELDFKREGFFVEIGATNGISFSNTYMLETQYGWNGILAEPAKCWHEDLDTNRSCSIEKKCVYSSSDMELIFNETEARMLSTIDSYSSLDSWATTRTQGKKYPVQTISMNDLLSKYDAPTSIDYLSIDTEGSEYEILRALDFHRYSFKVITCEHNDTVSRENIYKLLTSKGYKRKFESLPFAEDWFIRSEEW